MKLDVNVLRYLSKDEFRVLTAVEMGMKNHEIVPTELVERIAGLNWQAWGAFKNVKTLLRHKLVHHDSSKYDGYRLTNLGYDFLAIKTMANRGLIAGVGRQIGVGKESDIFEVITEEGETLALKLHRLGRTSFRAVKSKRDYLKHRSSFNWLYLSRLAALKEFAFMKALGENGFPVPKAVDWNRHCVLMSLVPGYPLVQIKELQNPVQAFDTIIGLIVRLAEHGLIHCDFNEFNIMIDDNESITMIDFPQMVSVSHENAEMYFDRDVECILKFFNKRFTGNNNASAGIELSFEDRPDFQSVANMAGSLDRQLEASGFTRQDQMELEKYTLGEKKEGEDDVDSPSDGTDNEDNCSEETENEASASEQTNHDNSLQIKSNVLNADEINGVSSQLISSGLDDQPEVQPEDGLVNNEQHSKGLEKRRKQAATAVRAGVRTYKSRNSTKDKGGRRSRNVSNKIDF